jgi:hypothetical protein
MASGHVPEGGRIGGDAAIARWRAGAASLLVLAAVAAVGGWATVADGGGARWRAGSPAAEEPFADIGVRLLDRLARRAEPEPVAAVWLEPADATGEADPLAGPAVSPGPSGSIARPGGGDAMHAGRGAARIFVHHTVGSLDGARAAATTADRLADAGETVAGIRTVGHAISALRVRYFFAADRDRAAAVARQIGTTVGGPVRVEDFTHFRPLPAPGVIEVWLP